MKDNLKNISMAGLCSAFGLALLLYILNSNMSRISAIVVFGIGLLFALVRVYLSLPDTIKIGKEIPFRQSVLPNLISLFVSFTLIVYIGLFVTSYKTYDDYKMRTSEANLAQVDQMFEIANQIPLRDSEMVYNVIKEFTLCGGKFEVDSQKLLSIKNTILGMTSWEGYFSFPNEYHYESEFEELAITIRASSNKRKLAYEMLHELGHFLEIKALTCGSTIDRNVFILFEDNPFNVSGQYLQKDGEQFAELFAQSQMLLCSYDEYSIIESWYKDYILNNEYSNINLYDYYDECKYKQFPGSILTMYKIPGVWWSNIVCWFKGDNGNENYSKDIY